MQTSVLFFVYVTCWRNFKSSIKIVFPCVFSGSLEWKRCDVPAINISGKCLWTIATMYFPVGWPKILDIAETGDSCQLLKICCDRVKILFAILTEDSLRIWYTKVCCCPHTKYLPWITPWPPFSAMCANCLPSTECKIDRKTWAEHVGGVETRFQHACGCGESGSALSCTSPSASPDRISHSWSFFVDGRGNPAAVFLGGGWHTQRNLQSDRFPISEPPTRQCWAVCQGDHPLSYASTVSRGATLCACHLHLLRQHLTDDGGHEGRKGATDTLGWSGGARFLTGSQTHSL